MPMHGRVHINETEIMAWWVGREDKLKPSQLIYKYHWQVMVVTPDGESTAHYEGDVWHRYDDGAEILLSLVMQAVHAQRVKEEDK